MDDLQAVKDTLLRNGFVVTGECDLPNGTGVRITLEGGGIVNVYNTGTIQVQGKPDARLTELFPRNGAKQAKATSGPASAPPSDRRVFVVYGHDQQARTSLEAMLRRWQLEPVILDQLPSEGQTIIEKLENTINHPCFAVVLATPDDEGHRRDKPAEERDRHGAPLRHPGPALHPVRE